MASLKTLCEKGECFTFPFDTFDPETVQRMVTECHSIVLPNGVLNSSLELTDCPYAVAAAEVEAKLAEEFGEL